MAAWPRRSKVLMLISKFHTEEAIHIAPPAEAPWGRPSVEPTVGGGGLGEGGYVFIYIYIYMYIFIYIYI